MLKGSPSKVPEHRQPKLAQRDRQFEHGSSGSQGGDRGNEYQAAWMTLACLNGVYSQQQILQEIILEGSHEPFDDIEIRTVGGGYTFFQSKHRDKSGSDNITIAELVKLPPPKNSGTKDSAAFSLAKYFRGMMKEYAKGNDITTINFIIGVSAGFSKRFKKKNADKKYVGLEDDTWTTTGILQDLPEGNVDPLLSQIRFSDHTQSSIVQFVATKHPGSKAPSYTRFSDDFINNIGLTPSQIILRTKIFDAIKSFIVREKEAAWVTDDMQGRPEYYINLFLQYLQLWINQPKLEVLMSVVTYSLEKNFGMGVERIHHHFFDDVKRSSDRKSLSMDLDTIQERLRSARGAVLAEVLQVRTSDYAEEHLVGKIAIKDFYASQPLTDFLDNKAQHVCLLNSSSPQELKYLAGALMFQGDFKWCLIHGQTHPLFHEHMTDGYIEHGIEDLLLTEKFQFIIIDEAEALLDTDYGQRQLALLCNTKQTKIILISHSSRVDELQGLLQIPRVIVSNPQVALVQEQIAQIVNDMIVLKPNIATLNRRLLDVNNAIAQCSSLAAVLARPSILASFARDLCGAGGPAEIVPDAFQVPHYHPVPMPVRQPYYRISEMISNACVAQIHVENISLDQIEIFTKLVPDNARMSEDGKTLYLLTERGQGTLYVKCNPKLGESIVEVTGFSHDHERTKINCQLDVPAEGFLKKSKEMNADLLGYPDSPLRTLLVADYGMGKTSLYKHLFASWLQQRNLQDVYEWVIPCQLPSIAELVNQDAPLVTIILQQLINASLLEGPVSVWLRASLNHALENGNLLLLLDRWDEVDKTQFEAMNTWLVDLPRTINYIVFSRPHAAPELMVKFHQRVALSLFTWEDIERYIQAYFNNDDFRNKLFDWLGHGGNEEVVDILERPLHLRLLVEALTRYFLIFNSAVTDDEKAEVESQAPWNDGALYRVKLYQMIIQEQLRKYLISQCGEGSLANGQDMKLIALFTQAHQLRLREIGFQLIFDKEPVKLISAIDDQLLLDELYRIGIIDSSSAKRGEIKFVYRIFSEYFAALYLLNGLLRGEGDFLFQQVIDLIQTNGVFYRYEEVWRILGELIRYGEPFLNYPGIGKSEDVFAHWPILCGDDEFASYYSYLEQCLNGADYKERYDYRKVSDPNWFQASDEEEEEEYRPAPMAVSRVALLKEARGTKQWASSTVRQLIGHGQMTESWLAYFYHKTDCTAHATEEKIDKDIAPSLKNLKNKVNEFKWPEKDCNGYWDVDVYLPSVGHMHPRIFLMGAAYFIHRISNKNSIYYNSQVAVVASRVIERLTKNKLDGNNSYRIYYTMLSTWLSHPYLINGLNAPIENFISTVLNRIFHTIKSENKKLQFLSINALYGLAMVFKLRLSSEAIDDDTMRLTIRAPAGKIHYQYEVTTDRFDLMQRQLNALKAETDFGQQKLVEFCLDGKDLERIPVVELPEAMAELAISPRP